MRIENLQYMLTIAEVGSISKAAELIRMQKSSLSSAVQAVENELGFRIFDRGSGGVALTEEGKQALAIAAEIVDSYKNLQNIGTQQEALLSVCVNYSISELFYTEVYAKLLFTLPKVQMNTYKIRPETYLITRKAKDTPREIAVDCYMKKEMDEMEKLAKQKGYALEQLSTFRLMAYVNRSNPLAKKDSITRDMLAGQNFFFGVDPLLADPEKRLPFGNRFKVIDGGDFLQLIRIVNSSDAIGIFPEYKNLPFSPALNDFTEVIPVPITGDIEYDITYVECLIYPQKTRFSADEMKLLELIRSVIHD